MMQPIYPINNSSEETNEHATVLIGSIHALMTIPGIGY